MNQSPDTTPYESQHAAKASVAPPVRKRRVGFVGAGYIADWHAKAIATVANTELVASCDRVMARAEGFGRRFGVAGVYGSLDAMLAAEQLDAVHILLPPDLHFEAAKAALEADVDVLLEKPMCSSADDCRALVRLARERDLRLGVGHNFLFAEPYEKLRGDVQVGLLGKLLDVSIVWHRPLPQAVHGPFESWMLRNPRNILLETGSHSVAHMLDLLGCEPTEVRVHPSSPIELPTGIRFYRRWLVDAACDNTAIRLLFSFGQGFSEYTIHVRGTLGAAEVDFERNTYTLRRHTGRDQDFDYHAMTQAEARSLKQQARGTLRQYILAKLKLAPYGNPYGASIARLMANFHAREALDPRAHCELGARTIRLCEEMGTLAGLPRDLQPEDLPANQVVQPLETPRILLLGATGFIGKEVVRQLSAAGRRVRLLARSAANLPAELRTTAVEIVSGDGMNPADLARAMQGIETVVHLARANVKSWSDYQRFEIGMTRAVAEAALLAGVKRLVYTGTIDSYYAGRHAGTITEQTPLDKSIAYRNLYARAKAESEKLLFALHRERQLPLVVVRPGIVIGRGGSPFHWGVGMWWNDAFCRIWGRGENKLPLVLVEDVARGIVAACDKPGIEGRSYNLVAEPCLTAQEYLDELDRAGRFRVQRQSTSICSFYAKDLFKWAVKVAVRFPEHRLPSYWDWESRTQRARFDCTAAREELGWRPASDRTTIVRQGIEVPLKEYLR